MKRNLSTRKIIRLQGYDYSAENIYFVTLCIKDRIELLGKIENENIKLSIEGNIAKKTIHIVEQIYPNLTIDEYVIMPNHIHFLISINYANGITISKVIKHFKTIISKELKYSIWQKSFYEHIVRNEKEYLKIKEYIRNNIINWEKDKYF